MEMPKTVFVRAADADNDCIDPAEIVPRTKDVYFAVTETAEEVAVANGTVRLAEYRFVRMVEVKRETKVTTSVTPVE